MFLLHEAAKTGQIGVARWLIDHRRMSVNTFNMEGCSPLYCACNAGHVELAQLLLEHGANVNRGDRDESRTPLLYACINGNIDIVQLLLSHGADIMAKGTAKRSLWQHVMHAGEYQQEILQLLIQYGANVNELDQFGCAVLHYACIRRRTELLRFCLQQGADVAVHADRLFEGGTGLHFCTTVDTACLLLDHGADICAPDGVGSSALHHVVKVTDNFALIHFLLDRGLPVDLGDSGGHTALVMACNSGRIDNARILLERGANVNNTNRIGRTPLFSTRLNCVDLLLKHGANPNIQDTYGCTALHQEANHKIVDLLLQGGANANARNNRGETPLCRCFLDSRILLSLVSNGANVNAKDSAGCPVLHRVVLECSNNAALLEALLERNVDLNAVDETGSTVLHSVIKQMGRVVVEESQLEWCRRLLQAGADQSIRDHEGNIPLHIACAAPSTDKMRCHKFIRFLVETHPYVVSIRDREGFLPLHLACMNDDPELETIYTLFRLDPIESLAPLRVARRT